MTIARRTSRAEELERLDLVMYLRSNDLCEDHNLAEIPFRKLFGESVVVTGVQKGDPVDNPFRIYQAATGAGLEFKQESTRVIYGSQTWVHRWIRIICYYKYFDKKQKLGVLSMLQKNKDLWDPVKYTVYQSHELFTSMIRPLVCRFCEGFGCDVFYKSMNVQEISPSDTLLLDTRMTCRHCKGTGLQ